MTKATPYRHSIKQCLLDAGRQALDANTISSRTGIPLSTVRQAISAMMVAKIIYASGGSARHRYYRAGKSPAARERTRCAANQEKPIRASTMPNGDKAYWERHVSEMMTPARVGAANTEVDRANRPGRTQS
jgi:hypothetical protein